MSTMLVPSFIFTRYVFFLGKVLSVEEQAIWFDRRKEMVKNKEAFSDLVFLNKFIIQEDKRNLIRKNT